MRFAFPTRVALSSVPSENSRKFSEMRLTLSLASYSECVLYWSTTVLDLLIVTDGTVLPPVGGRGQRLFRLVLVHLHSVLSPVNMSVVSLSLVCPRQLS